MLHLRILNVGGPDDSANYDWSARVNHELIDRGRVGGHDRSKGWRDLVRMIAGESPEVAALRERVAALEAAIENVRAAVSQPPDSYEGDGLWWDSRGEAAVEALLAMLPEGGA